MMGLGSLLHRNLVYNVTDTVTGAASTFTIHNPTRGAYADWDSGEYRGGMSLPGAWRAATLQADLLGGAPWHAYRARPGAPAERLEPTPPLLEQPNPGEPRVTTFSAWHLDLLWHGNAIALVAARNRTGWPTAVLPVPADSVFVKRVEESDRLPLPLGEIIYNVSPIPGAGSRWYQAQDVLHVKGTSRPGALRGMGILEQHLATTLSLADELQAQARGIAKHAVPSVLIKSLNPDLDQATSDALKAKLMESQRTRQPMVLNPSTEVEPLAWNPTESQLIEARKFSLHEVALMFGLDPSWLGVSGASMTYSNVEQEAVNLVKFSLGGHFARFEQTLSLHMPRGTWAEANLDGILRADTLTRYQAHAIAIERGFMTRDEVREVERRAPLTPAQRDEVLPPPAPPAAPGPAAPPPGAPQARANPDATGDDLHQYWTKGAGLAKWADHAHPWSALYEHLLKYLPANRARATASAWFEDVFGYPPSARQGDNPVGKG